MKLDTTQARQIMAIHYLPGIRLAIDELTALVRDMEMEVAEAVPQEAEEDKQADVVYAIQPVAKRKKRKKPHYSDQQKIKIAKQAKQVGVAETVRLTGISRSAVSRWVTEFKEQL